MQCNAKRRWAKRGLLDVIMNDDGFFFFMFLNEQDLLAVLEEGVYMVEGKPLILQRWHSQVVLSKEVPGVIPLWGKIFNIPLQYWNKEGLSHIESGVGNIFMADSLTEQMCRMATGRLSFAKLLIEVEATRKLSDNLFVLIPGVNGDKEVEVCFKVEYPWRPSWCGQCLKFGHSLHVCPVVAANKIQENKSKESVPGGGSNSAIPEDEFQVVQRCGKEKVVENNRGNQRFSRGGVGGKNQFRYINKGVVIRDNQDRGNKSGSLKAVNYREVNNRSQGKIGVQNRFDILDAENMEELIEVNRDQDVGNYREGRLKGLGV
ncbi:uncharacterized protein LOC141673806 [Apium graveolens]|uniref:uncharacterized protein LOC141673806 n=1 Tax=Apium graveolens TaxID=4045 RepID=UPI003D7BFE43